MRIEMEQRPLVVSRVSARWDVPPKPGIHSYNLERRWPYSVRIAGHRPNRALRWARILLLLVGLSGIGFYAYTAADQAIYQAYANWAFDQHIAGHSATFLDYLRTTTWLGLAWPVAKSPELAEPAPTAAMPQRPAPGDVLGRVVIPRLNMSAVVLEGVDDSILRRSAGHIPSTALPGQVGNFSIAAHRDTLFRPLKDIRPGDEVEFATPKQNLVFHVVSTKIVKPTDVSVLAAEGDSRLLTMITCYPFYYVGSAPERFVVKATLDSTGPAASTAAPASQKPIPLAASARRSESQRVAESKAALHRRSGVQVSARHTKHNGFLRADNARRASAGDTDPALTRPNKKHRFWSRIARVF